MNQCYSGGGGGLRERKRGVWVMDQGQPDWYSGQDGRGFLSDVCMTLLAKLLLLILQYNEYANDHVLYNYRLYTKRRSIFHLLHYTVMLCPAQHIRRIEINCINQ